MNKLIQYCVMAAVGVLVFASLLIPVINEASATTDTFTNDGAFYVEANPTDTYTIEYDKTVNPGVVYINDEAMDIPFSTGYTIMALDTSILRLQSGDSTIQYKGNGQYITGIYKLNLSVSGGNVTGTFRSPTLPDSSPDSNWPTTTYNKCYIASPTEQALIMTVYNTVNKVNGDSDIFAFGQTTINAGTPFLALINIYGNIDDGVNVDLLNSTTGAAIEGYTVENLSINKTAVAGYLDLYDLSSITFNVTDGEYTTAVTYSAYIIPAEVTAEKAIHADDSTRAVLGVIPLIVIVGLIVGVVGVIAVRRGA